MPRLPKCKYCGEAIKKEDLIIKIDINSKGKEKKTKIHKQCEKEYDDLMEFKSNELKWFDELYNHIKIILGYTNEQLLPNYLITRLQDLRNGTVMQKGIGRVVKSKEGYKYEVILDTFLSQSDKIEWVFNNKQFKNERNKINYMMAIIENNINDNYIYFQEKENSQIRKRQNNLMQEEKEFIKHNKNLTDNNLLINKEHKQKGISKFLEEDEL
ncbi:hypothetical protein EXM90_19005 [Clostridium botulinum]|uniref:hypothetical protein n=1 Tax=Clostridium botulinum TaxID=1491 RepID=UPI000774AF39|nr:hypothetical protein [Clostridium botulinum]MBN3367046.1 hypothetical protein [Clostridium botulinum]MBN3371682.1 hypothetical protein [Clostridium botulinum]MBN3375512.1 hypothetical protein [Clostridium botulinum]MBN3384169.1 hypothetical protein [Clostridium botulinum]MBN3402866.1 hypothetical protein [Clostridium botulinum]